MKALKNNWYYILIFILFTILSIFFAYTGDDWFWASGDALRYLKRLFIDYNGRYLSDIIIILLSRFKILKIITYGILCTCMFVVMRNTVNKKNNTLLYIGIFLFLLIDTTILNQGFVWASGFVNYFISGVLLLVLINYLVKDSFFKVNKILLFIFGLVSCLFLENVSILILLVTIGYIIYKKKTKQTIKSVVPLLNGALTGTAFMFANPSYWGNAHIGERTFSILNAPQNLLHTIIPEFYGKNFLIVLLLIAFLLFLCIKIFSRGTKKERVLTLLSITSIFGFGVTYLLSSIDLLNYIMLVLFTVASLYILLHANNSKMFKRKIIIYYIFKIGYILPLIFIGPIGPRQFMFPFIMDILILLELVNYVLPNNFLEKSWTVFTVLFLLTNIYIYQNVYYKNVEFNKIIKRNVECGTYNVKVPSKYYTELYYNFAPIYKYDKNYYIEYYDIDTPYYFTITFK